MDNLNNDAFKREFKLFAFTRIIVGILITIAVLWVVGSILGFFDKPAPLKIAQKYDEKKAPVPTEHKTGTRDLLGTEASREHATGQKAGTRDLHGTEASREHATGQKAGTRDLLGTEASREHATGQKTGTRDLLGTEASREHATGQKAGIRDLLGTEASREHATGQKTGTRDLLGTEASREHATGQKAGIRDLHGTEASREHATGQKAGTRDAHGTEAAKEHATESHEPGEEASGHADAQKTTTDASKHAPTAHPAKKDTGHGATDPDPNTAKITKPRPKGVAFVEAAIKPLDFELSERFYGWRPNDILDFTDNINNFQLGVLEVTRRTAVILAERLSRTGATAAFDKNLENAMNWFMIKSDRYWFPSPESKYKAGLKELREYKKNLEKGEANFHIRPDNLIPLLVAFEDLLGSCEENLVKREEAGGTPVSHFKADDYFYYAKGIASAMGTILEAILEDFLVTVESRRGTEVLHHAIESCHHAMEINPMMITNSKLSGILANHRANLAAPMSHARFYIGVLIKTLST